MLVKTLLRIVVSGALLTALAWRTDWAQVGRAFAQLRVELWLAAVAVYFGTQLASASRWRLLAGQLGLRCSFWEMAGFCCIGMYFNLILPTSVGGDVVRAWYLDRHTGRRRTAFLSVFIDRLSGLAVLVALAGVATLASPVPLPLWVSLSVAGVVAGAVLGFAALPFLARHRLLGERYAALGEELSTSLRLLARPTPVALSVVVQVANVFLVWLVGVGLGVPVPFAYYWVLVPMVTLLTLLPVSINGMGVREAATLLFLRHLDVPDGLAVSLSFLWFCVYTAAGLGAGAVYLLGRFSRPEVTADHGPVRHHPDQGRSGQFKAAA